jgi:hypothetical protein
LISFSLDKLYDCIPFKKKHIRIYFDIIFVVKKKKNKKKNGEVISEEVLESTLSILYKDIATACQSTMKIITLSPQLSMDFTISIIAKSAK